MNNAPDAVDLLKKLIACRSVTPASDGSLDMLGELFAAAGFSVQRLDAGGVDNLWAHKGDSTRLLFAGHVDVVPPGDLSLWESDPFCAAEKDGFIIGRGAADMKSGVAAMTAALLAERADGSAIFLTSDEEGAAEHGTRHFCDWWQRQNRRAIDCCIVGEPTSEQAFGDAIKIGRRGSLTCYLTVHGKQAHAAYPARGDNPLHRLTEALQPLIARWRDNIAAQQRGEWVTTFQAVSIQGGAGADNVTPSRAEAILNFRYAPPDTAETLQQQVIAALAAAAADRRECEWRHSAEPYCLPADSELVAALRAAAAAQTGREAALTTGGGASDGRFLRHICGQVAEFGVLNAGIHAPNEKVAAADVHALAAIYGAIIRKLL